jgi:hypothetical protein
VARANLIKAIVKLKRLILRRPVGFPWGYDLLGLTLLCGANEEVVLKTPRSMAESGCIKLEELTDIPPYHVRIVCLPPAKEHRCREIGSTNI